MQALLAAGANTDVVSEGGAPLLVTAAEVSVPVAVALVQASADVNCTDPSGQQPLDVAVRKGEMELCELLMLRGAKPTRARAAAFRVNAAYDSVAARRAAESERERR